jgi:transposase-like protein
MSAFRSSATVSQLAKRVGRVDPNTRRAAVDNPSSEPHYGEDSEQEPTYGESGPREAGTDLSGERNPDLHGAAAEVAESEDDPSTTPGAG